MDRISDLRAEIDPSTFDQLNIRENLKNIVDMENIRNRGFNTAINSITSILDTSKMGYQYIENLKNARELLIREYEDTDTANLPDERYQIRLRYYDNAQLIEDRKAFDVQLKSFETEVLHLWDVLEMIYEDSKFLTRVTDFADLANLYKRKIRKNIKEKSGDPLYEDIAKVWDEISFVRPAETEVERMNRTYIYEKDKLRHKIILMRDKMKGMYGYQYPIQRRVMEERLVFLEKEFNRFDYMINPYHIQPGLLLDLDITSIKRKKATLDGMAGVLNEFLHGVSKGFQDAAFASFSRRRSTVRQDIAQSFAESPVDGRAVNDPAKAYLDMLNGDDDAKLIVADSAEPVLEQQAPKQAARRGRGKATAGVVDAKPSSAKRGRRPKSNDGLREI
jgi:hypothetical protein